MQTISELLNTIPGAFFFHLTVTLTILGVYVVLSGGLTERTNLQTFSRIQWGIGSLLALRILLFILSLLISANFLPDVILPPLERGIGMTAIGIAVWAWGFPKTSQAADWGAGISVLIFLLATAIGIFLWLPAAAETDYFSGHWLDRAMGFLSILAATSGGAILIASRPDHWVYGLIQFGILLLAEVVHLFLPEYPSDYVLEVRLAQIAAYPLFFALPLRLQRAALTESMAFPVQAVPRASTERKKYNLTPAMLGNFLKLASERDMNSLFQQVTEIIAYSFVSDICFLIAYLEEKASFIVNAGYHLILEQPVNEGSIHIQDLPLIQSSFQKKSPLRLHASSTSLDLVNLGTVLDVEKTGHLLLVPLQTPPNIVPMAIGLYSPYSNRTWGVEEQEQLEMAALLLAEIIKARVSDASTGEKDDAWQEDLRSAYERIQDLERENEQLRSEILSPANNGETAYPFTEEQWAAHDPDEVAALEEKIRHLELENQALLDKGGQPEGDPDSSRIQGENEVLMKNLLETEEQLVQIRQNYESVELEYQQAVGMIEDLRQRNSSLKDEIEQLNQKTLRASENGQSFEREIQHVEAELEKSLSEVARLQKINGEAEIRILQLENLAKSAHDETRNWEIIISAAEDMRQPMSAIIGYSDFLLSESVGLLGALQKKFLERVKSSTERMNAMVENLIRIASDESGHIKLTIGMVNINASIDAAIASIRDQIREKNILMRVDIPEELPEIIGDPEAIRLTLIHLLQNAVAATPENQEIAIRASLEDFDQQGEYTLITVSDSGEGVSSEDIPNIFNRKFAAKHKAIEGLGAPGIGLTITKTLIEAHGGRIWVESEAETGTTFHILIPTTHPSRANPEAGMEE